MAISDIRHYGGHGTNRSLGVGGVVMGLRRTIRPTNLVLNGNFAKGTTNWSAVQGSFSASGGEVSYLCTSQYGNVRQESINIISGHKYYYAAWVKASSNLVGIKIVAGAWNSTIKRHSGSGAYERLSYIDTATASSANSQFRILEDDRASGWDTVYAYGGIVVDLTVAFAGMTEPTLAQCDAYFADWFNATANSGSMSRSLR